MVLVVKEKNERHAPKYGVPLLEHVRSHEEQRGPYYDAAALWIGEEKDDEEGLRCVISAEAWEGGTRIIFGRAAPSSSPRSVQLFGTSVLCPAAAASARGLQLRQRHHHPRVGAVVLPRHPQHPATLLTRRHSRMRTFPRAWAFPGGSLDPGETTAQAAGRELEEETGLRIVPGSLKLLALWESVYPTNLEQVEALGGIAGHHLVVFYTATVLDPSTLLLQPEETDGHQWVPDDAWVHICTNDPSEADPSLLQQLHGIYPNEYGEGIAQGHLFAVDVLLRLGAHFRLRDNVL